MTARKSSLFSINEKSIQPYDIEEQGKRGDPICVSTLSSHCNGPFKCNSIQQGVDVTVCRRYAAPQPFTKLIRIVHIRVNWYTASNPCETDCDNSAANSWLLNIFKLQPGKEKNHPWNMLRFLHQWTFTFVELYPYQVVFYKQWLDANHNVDYN